MAQIFPGKLSWVYVHRHPGKREVQMWHQRGFFAGKSRDGRDDLTLGHIKAGFQRLPGNGVAKRRQKLSAAGPKDGVAHIDGPAQKIPVDLDDAAGKSPGDFSMLIHGFRQAANIFITVQVQTFMESISGALITPPLPRGLKQHARVEDPPLKPIHPGPVVLHHKFHKSAFEFGGWGHGCFGQGKFGIGLIVICGRLAAGAAPGAGWGTAGLPCKSPKSNAVHLRRRKKETIFVMLSEAKHLKFGDSSVASLPQNDRIGDLPRAFSG
jgi:hypothetical protein